MNTVRRSVFTFLILLSAIPAWSEGAKAVTAFSEDTGFKLSQRAMTTMGIQFGSISTPPWKLPKTALVNIKHVTGVYRRVDGWIDFVIVTVDRSDGNWVWITSPDLEPGDDVAVANADFLRMTEAELKSDSTDACAH